MSDMNATSEQINRLFSTRDDEPEDTIVRARRWVTVPRRQVDP